MLPVKLPRRHCWRSWASTRHTVFQQRGHCWSITTPEPSGCGAGPAGPSARGYHHLLPVQRSSLSSSSRAGRKGAAFSFLSFLCEKRISSTSTFLKFLPNLSGVIDVNNSAWSSLPVHRQEIETVTVLFAYSLFHLDSTQCSTLPKAAVF